MTRAEIVIPCFNESGNLQDLLVECRKIIMISDDQLSFILVNNGSTDNTEEFFQIHQFIDPKIKFMSVHPNRGYGGGIAAGLDASTADIIGWTHADLQTPLKDCLEAIEGFSSNIGMVKGSRVGRKLGDRFFTFSMSVFESILFGNRLSEINAQPTLILREVYATWRDKPLDFSLDLYALVMAHQAKIVVKRMPVIFRPRIRGESKWNTGITSTFKFSLRTIRYSLRLRRNL